MSRTQIKEAFEAGGMLVGGMLVVFVSLGLLWMPFGLESAVRGVTRIEATQLEQNERLKQLEWALLDRARRLDADCDHRDAHRALLDRARESSRP